MPLGTMVHNVELKIGKGGQIARGAGTSAQLMAKEGDYALLRLPSGEIRKVHINCRATIGQVGNIDAENICIGKAGRSRWLGIRPANRGVVMNPNDHPHGGVKVILLLAVNVLLLLGVNVHLVLVPAKRKKLLAN